MDKKDKIEYNSITVYQAETNSFATLQDSASFSRAYTKAKGSCFVTINNEFFQIGGGLGKKSVSLFTYEDGKITQDFQVCSSMSSVVEFLI